MPREELKMAYNNEKIDEMVLALLHLTSFKGESEIRTWKNHDWDAMDRIHEKGLISNPKNKAKSVAFTDEGKKMAEDLFGIHFNSN